MVRNYKGKTVVREFKKTASATFSAGSVVDLTSGYLTNVDSSSSMPLGVVLDSVDSTDDNYASTTVLKVQVPLDPATEWEMTVSSNHALAAEDVGTQMDFSDHNKVNAAGSSHDPVTCVGFISATKGRFVFNGHPFHADGA